MAKGKSFKGDGFVRLGENFSLSEKRTKEKGKSDHHFAEEIFFYSCHKLILLFLSLEDDNL